MLPLLAAAAAVLGHAAPASAQRAGTHIVNLATAGLDIEGSPTRIASNVAALRVAELLDIGLVARGESVLAAGQQLAAFALVNAGNGDERFYLAGTIEGAAGKLRGFAVDGNGNGVLDAGEAMLDGATTPVVAPGQTLQLLALFDTDAGAATGALSVFARAATGSGRPGTLYAGRGDQGTDALVGATTAEATLRFAIAPGAVPDAALVKSQSVRAPDGSASVRRGATITYSLAARFTGDGAARGAAVSDAIPAGTSYVPGSLTLDGAALSDAPDGDAGDFDGSRIAVALGDVAAPQIRIIQFKVTIQ